MGFLQSQQWQFSPRESKHYALKVVLQASLNSGTGTMKPTPKKNKALLSVFGKGVWGEIKVSQKHLLGRCEINLHPMHYVHWPAVRPPFVTSLYKCVLNVSSSNCWLDHPMHFALRKTTTLPHSGHGISRFS